MDNLKEFKRLILKYESITVEDIQNSDSYQKTMNTRYGLEIWYSENVMNELTGFGNTDQCILCTAIKFYGYADIENCKDCTWVKETRNTCCEGENKHTYAKFDKIEVESEEDLVDACKARAEYMRDTIQWFEKELD